MQSLPQTDVEIIVRANDAAWRRPEPSRAESRARGRFDVTLKNNSEA